MSREWALDVLDYLFNYTNSETSIELKAIINHYFDLLEKEDKLKKKEDIGGVKMDKEIKDEKLEDARMEYQDRPKVVDGDSR